MVFKRLLGALGVGGPTVDTVLAGGAVQPGGVLQGQVHLEGGTADVEIEHIALELVARVEAETGEGEHEGRVVFHRVTVGGGFRLAEGERQSVPFAVPVPWETPVTELYGQPLGIVLGVRTELAVKGARDKGDLDPLAVSPLPVQEAVLEAFGQLGFGFKTADLELGHIRGTAQTLPFYQEIELHPAPQYAHAVNEIEVTFLAGPAGVDVILEADKRGGLFSSGHDAVNRFSVSHDSINQQQDWNAVVDGWVRQLFEHRASYGGHGAPGPYGQPPYGHGDPHHGSHHGHHGHGGPGMGTVMAAGAAGVVGGMVAGEIVEEVVEEIFEDEGDEE